MLNTRGHLSCLRFSPAPGCSACAENECAADRNYVAFMTNSKLTLHAAEGMTLLSDLPAVTFTKHPTSQYSMPAMFATCLSSNAEVWYTMLKYCKRVCTVTKCRYGLDMLLQMIRLHIQKRTQNFYCFLTSVASGNFVPVVDAEIVCRSRLKAVSPSTNSYRMQGQYAHKQKIKELCK